MDMAFKYKQTVNYMRASGRTTSKKDME
jgi:hypothetical protein